MLYSVELRSLDYRFGDAKLDIIPELCNKIFDFLSKFLAISSIFITFDLKYL